MSKPGIYALQGHLMSNKLMGEFSIFWGMWNNLKLRYNFNAFYKLAKINIKSIGDVWV